MCLKEINWFCLLLKTISFSALISLVGLTFAWLKYKLDQANYQKSLFEERYNVFSEIDGILWCCFHEESKSGEKTDWHYCVSRLDSIYRKSYFLFSKRTYQFILKFRGAVVDFKMLEGNTSEEARKKTSEAHNFLSDLLDGQKLSLNFPELKIDFYEVRSRKWLLFFKSKLRSNNA